MRCPTCQQTIPDEARFCLQCGTAVAAGLATGLAEPERAALDRALGGQYEIVRLLGRGGMGAVYLARERALDRAVAIKVLPPEMAADADGSERFRREARTAAKLTHPNIVPLYSVGEAEGMLFFVMGYVRGESLGDRMRREGKLPFDDARRILSQLADALHYAHRQGVIHRDIKPDNVLLEDESGRPMLTDFGVAKASASGNTLTVAGAVVGTPHYMSPEQASGERDLDGRSDLYSLGVMGYAMLSGRLPFEGESFRDVMIQHMTRAPTPLRSMVADVPADLDAVITRALMKDAASRWSDGGAFALALGGGGDDEHELEGDKGAGVVVLAGWAAAGTLGLLIRTTQFLGARAGHDGPRWWLLPLFLVAVSTVPIGVMALVKRYRGEKWRALLDRFMLQPRGWLFWWPKRWRRPGDVWDRLPAPVRRSRLLVSAVGPLYWVAMVCFVIVVDRYSHELVPPRWMEHLMLGGVTGGAVVFISAMLNLRPWARGAGLSQQEQSKVMLTPTAKLEFWRRRKFAEILLPAAGSRASISAAEPRNPQDYVRAISERAGDLAVPMKELGREAMSAARQMLLALETLDNEIAVLARDADPAELAQVEQKLSLPVEGATEPAHRRELRQMLENQRDLLRRLAGQLTETTRRRDRMVDLLRTLWLQVASLRAEAVRDSRMDSEITGRIRAVVAEIAALENASATLRVGAPGGIHSE